MKKRIKRLKLPERPPKRFHLGYQDESGKKIEIWEIAEKLNEVIDHLNDSKLEVKEDKTSEEGKDIQREIAIDISDIRTHISFNDYGKIDGLLKDIEQQIVKFGRELELEKQKSFEEGVKQGRQSIVAEVSVSENMDKIERFFLDSPMDYDDKCMEWFDFIKDLVFDKEWD